MGPATRFVILGQSRSGSTLVVRLLDAHPDVVCEGEIFNADWGYYPRPLLAIGRRLPEPFLWNRRIRSRAEAYGAKVLVYHVEKAPVFFARLHQRGWKMIAVTRRDVLRAALSFGIGRATASWHRRTDDPIPDCHVSVEPELIIEQLSRRQRWKDLEQEVLARVPHHALEYERDLADVGTRTEAMRGVLDYLGLSQLELTTDLSPTDHRPLSDVVTNLDEILDRVAASPWAKVLERFDPEPL